MLEYIFPFILAFQIDTTVYSIPTNIEPFYQEPTEKTIRFGFDWFNNAFALIDGKQEWWRHYKLIIDF